MNYKEELRIVTEKWLTISDRDECENVFEKYWFYRFVPYISIFEKDWIKTDFSEVISLYTIDEKLREIIGKLSMLVELNVKAKIIEETKDIPWNEESLVSYYIIDPIKMETILSDIVEQHADKIKTQNNPEPTRLTTNFRKILRVASFWDMYSIYSNLNSVKKKAILLHYDVPREKNIPIFSSWLFSLRKIRNAWWHHEMCIMNPTYIRISTPFNFTTLNKKRSNFSLVRIPW